MSSPFQKNIRAQRLDPWCGPIHIPKGFDLRDWKGPEGQRCEYRDEAEDRRDWSAHILDNGPDKYAALARTYRLCCKEEACGLQMEPQCARRLRINFVGRAAKALTTHCSAKALWLVTLVPEIGKFRSGELHKTSLTEFLKYIRRMLVKAGLDHLFVIGVVDISYNENREKTWEPHWQLHVHLIAAGSTEEKLKRRLKKVFPRTATIHKPVEVKPVYDLLGALSYCCKAYFERRVSYIDNKGHWNARGDLPLKPAQFREVFLFMSTQGVASRFLFQRFRRRGRYLEPTS